MKYFRRRNWLKTKNKKKIFAENWSHSSPKLGKNKKKKRSSLQFATVFVRKFVGSFSPGWLFFLCSSSNQLSMEGCLSLNGGTLNLDGGRLSLDWGTHSPYNLSTNFVCFQLYVCSHFIVQYYSALSDRVWHGMEDDFFIFHTGSFLPFHIPIHTKNHPFYISFHTSIPRQI